MAGDFSRRHLAKGVHIRDDSDHWVPANDTEVEWSLPTTTSPTAHVEWTVSQILAHLEVSALTDDQLRKYATTCVGRCSCGDIACTTDGCMYAPHSDDSREDGMDTGNAPAPPPPSGRDGGDDDPEGGSGREQDGAASPPPASPNFSSNGQTGWPSITG